MNLQNIIDSDSTEAFITDMTIKGNLECYDSIKLINNMQKTGNSLILNPRPNVNSLICKVTLYMIDISVCPRRSVSVFSIKFIGSTNYSLITNITNIIENY